MDGESLRLIPLPMIGGQCAKLYYDHPMSAEDFEWMLKVLDKLKPRILGFPTPDANTATKHEEPRP